MLSPMLFNIFVHDMPQPKDVDVAQFADDTSYLAYSHRTSTVVNRLQRASDRITKFFSKWRIRVNAGKSQATLFTRKRAPRHRPQSQVTVCGEEVPWCPSTKYLGLHLDKTLTYAEHVRRSVEKNERAVRALYPLIGKRSKLDIGNKILLFKTVLRPGFSSACPIWEKCAAAHRLKLQRHQNRVLKMMMGVPIRTATSEVHGVTGVEMLSDFMDRLGSNFEARGLLNVNEDIVQLFE